MIALVAVDAAWGIGRGGDQLCYLPGDLARFKALTLGKTVIAGRKTVATFPGGRPLAGRRNLILSRDPAYGPEGAEVCRDLPAVLARAEDDAFVIGGASVYRALLPHCTQALVTWIYHTWEADCRFPDLDADPRWQLTARSPLLEECGLLYEYRTYEKTEAE